MKFTRDGQILLTVIGGIFVAVMFAAIGIVHTMRPHRTTFDSYLPYIEFALALFVLITIPVRVRRVNRKFDADEMLEDYRQRKKRRP
jgi:hypothetical protein